MAKALVQQENLVAPLTAHEALAAIDTAFLREGGRIGSPAATIGQRYVFGNRAAWQSPALGFNARIRTASAHIGYQDRFFDPLQAAKEAAPSPSEIHFPVRNS